MGANQANNDFNSIRQTVSDIFEIIDARQGVTLSSANSTHLSALFHYTK